MVYDKELLSEPTFLHEILRDRVFLKGHQYETAPSSNQLVQGLAHCFCTEKEDRQNAVSCRTSLRQPNFSDNAAFTNIDA